MAVPSSEGFDFDVDGLQPGLRGDKGLAHSGQADQFLRGNACNLPLLGIDPGSPIPGQPNQAQTDQQDNA
ncbi:MAG: hypothetical protein ACE5H9_07330 [Anaerolineae bacterium]